MGDGVRGGQEVRRGRDRGEDEAVTSEAANEDGEVSVGMGEALWVSGMVHLLLSPLGYHNHLPGSHLSLIQPLTRGEREEERQRERDGEREGEHVVCCCL